MAYLVDTNIFLRPVSRNDPDRHAVLNAFRNLRARNEDLVYTSQVLAEFWAVCTRPSLAESVASQLDDTRLAVGGEAMQAATQTYQYIKTAAKTTPGLKPAADQLGGTFPASRQAKGFRWDARGITRGNTIARWYANTWRYSLSIANIKVG